MASIRRTLFPSTPANVENCTDNSPLVLCADVSESSNTEKDCDNDDSKEFHSVAIEENTDRAGKKVLVVGVNMTSEICKQLASMPLFQDIQVLSCSPSNLLSICGKQKFTLIFIDTFCEESCILKICSTLRYNLSSLNETVPIIGVSDTEKDNTSNYGLNEIVTLPLREDAVNQLLLKFAGIIPFKELPLTPESPDDDVAVARKAAEIIRESEQQSMLNFNKNIYGTKERKEVESPFDSSEETEPQSKQMTCGLYNNSNTNLYLPSSSPMEDHTNTRQQTPNYNTAPSPDFTRNTVSPVDQEDTFRTKEHSAPWGVLQEYVPGHVTQSVSGSSGVVCGDHNVGCHGYSSVPGFCQHPSVPTSNQLPFKPVSQYRSGNTCDNKPQEKLLPPQDVTQPTVNMTTSIPEQAKVSTFGTPAYMVSGAPGTKDMKITIIPDDLSKHSSKERIRRERIKESCDKLRFLLPNISGKKTDMASILEMTVKFVKLVNERTPAPVMQEIANSLSVNTVSLCRKRAQKELVLHPSKQVKPRMASPQLAVPMASSVIPTDTQGHYRLRGQSMLSNSGPVYLSHVHGQNCASSPHQYSQYSSTVNYGSSYSPLAKDAQGGFYSSHTNVVNQGFACGVPKDITMVQNYPSQSTNNAPMCNPINTPISICSHRAMPGIPSSPLSDTPQQWSFLKLPPINTISPCGSTRFSQSSSEEYSTRSNISSPNGSMDSPLWDEAKRSSCPI